LVEGNDRHEIKDEACGQVPIGDLGMVSHWLVLLVQVLGTELKHNVCEEEGLARHVDSEFGNVSLRTAEDFLKREGLLGSN
jgi:hypothetical protein